MYDLSSLMQGYNRSYHWSIGIAPADETETDDNRIWARLYGSGPVAESRDPMPVGQKVQLNKAKGVFDKGYLRNWIALNFNDRQLVSGTKRPLYNLNDNLGEDPRAHSTPRRLNPLVTTSSSFGRS